MNELLEHEKGFTVDLDYLCLAVLELEEEPMA